MANTITTSIVVQFTKGDSGGAFTVEVDDRSATDGGLNGGKTSFLPGDTVYLLAYKTTSVIVDAAVASLGSLVKTGTATIVKNEDITFAGETTANLRYPVSSGFSYEWIGNSLGVLSLADQTQVQVPAPPAGAYAVGVARCTYTAQADIYRLSHSALAYSDYSIVAFFAGHTA